MDIQCYAALMPSSIVPEQVRAEVQKFWEIMCGKSHHRLEELYAPNALVLTGKARKPEPANQIAERRTRQIAPSAEAVAELGPVEIEVPESGIAIASYTYKFHQKRPDQSGAVLKRRTMFGRATQIFQQDESGRLRIVHEHLSAATNPEVEASPQS
jgi:ketosteroid isomerase-like protein